MSTKYGCHFDLDGHGNCGEDAALRLDGRWWCDRCWEHYRIAVPVALPYTKREPKTPETEVAKQIAAAVTRERVDICRMLGSMIFDREVCSACAAKVATAIGARRGYPESGSAIGVASAKTVHEGRMWQAANYNWPCPDCKRPADEHTDEEWSACLKSRERRYCCFVRCPNDAEFEIEDQRRCSDSLTDACTAHVGALLQDGVSAVWPLPGADSATSEAVTNYLASLRAAPKQSKCGDLAHRGHICGEFGISS